jgi:hypothetical protein
MLNGVSIQSRKVEDLIWLIILKPLYYLSNELKNNHLSSEK